MTKSDKGTSMAMDRLTQELKRQPGLDLQSLLRNVGNAFVNAQELCAQEAVYLTIGLPVKVATRSTIYVSTMPMAERQVALKSLPELRELDPACTDVLRESHFAKHSKRPESMSNICLADFLACYDRKASKNEPAEDADDNPLITACGEPPETYEPSGHDIHANNKHAHGPYKACRHAKTLRYRIPDRDSYPYEHMRAAMLLFLPWRDEAAEIELPCKQLALKFRSPDIAFITYGNMARYNKMGNVEQLAKKAEADAIAEMGDSVSQLAGSRQILQLKADRLYDESTLPLNPGCRI